MQVIRLHEKNSIRLSLIAFNLILLVPFILIMPAGHGKDSGASHRYALSNDGSVYRWSKDDGWDEIMDGLSDELALQHLAFPVRGHLQGGQRALDVVEMEQQDVVVLQLL